MRLTKRAVNLSEKQLAALLLAAAGAGVALYAWYAWSAGHWGFPLDDAWIHQTYARNLARLGSWAYVPGASSAGSTSPLWTGILAVGYLAGVPYRLWAFLMGALSLAAVGWSVARLLRRLFGSWAVAWLTAFACVLEWHQIWAAASGMETALFAALVLAVMGQGLSLVDDQRPRSWLLFGLLSGLTLLTRPEGLLAAGLTGLALLVARLRSSQRSLPSHEAGRFGLAALGFLLLALPYITFNLQVSGALLPNTFYAKQAEYAELAAGLSWANRVFNIIAVQFVGGQILLLPGLVAAWVGLARRKQWMAFVPLAWWFVSVTVYAARLPVTYQHGRYQMPLIPVLLVYAMPGTWALLRSANGLIARVVTRGLALGSALVFLGFVVVGAQTYMGDVRIIDTEMVDVARWLNANVPPDATIAVHDIGAIGYFTERPLLDLAGLISPEVVPFIRDEDRLDAYIRNGGASYLVTFPSWYPKLASAQGVIPIYTTNAPWAPSAGGENMVVYRLSVGPP